MTREEILTDAMRRMQAGEKLTYTDKDVELIMLGWQAELQKAVAAEREACMLVREKLPVPESCTSVERALWDVATLAYADAIRARGSQ